MASASFIIFSLATKKFYLSSGLIKVKEKTELNGKNIHLLHWRINVATWEKTCLNIVYSLA